MKKETFVAKEAPVDNLYFLGLVTVKEVRYIDKDHCSMTGVT